MKTDLYGNEVPWLLRAFGCFGIDRGRHGCLRFHWGEFSPTLGVGLSLDNAGPDGHGWMLHIRLLIVQAFIYLPLRRRSVKVGEMSESWGVHWLLDSGFGYGDIHAHWGYHICILHMPWHWEWVRTSYLLKDGTWLRETTSTQKQNRMGGNLDGWQRLRDYLADHAWTATHYYNYLLKNGVIQHRLAVIKVEEREWRWRWFRWSPWPRMIKRTIAVDFDQEVGERSGSWKGGCLGCGYDMRYGESALQCLRRMETERKF